MKRPQRPPQVTTLIDGYNLMFQSIKFPDARDGQQALQKARDFFLHYLADRLERRERQRTCVVFDSRTELLLPQVLEVREIQVLFAVNHNSADEMLCELIEKHSAPRNLTVVSSDHQIQKKANARGAYSIDSEEWVENFLSLLPVYPRESEVSSKLKNKKSSKQSNFLQRELLSRELLSREQLSRDLLRKLKEEKIDLGVTDDFASQIDSLLDSTNPEFAKDETEEDSK